MQSTGYYPRFRRPECYILARPEFGLKARRLHALENIRQKLKRTIPSRRWISSMRYRTRYIGLQQQFTGLYGAP